MIGRFQVQPVACCDLLIFFFIKLRLYSINSSELIGHFFVIRFLNIYMMVIFPKRGYDLFIHFVESS